MVHGDRVAISIISLLQGHSGGDSVAICIIFLLQSHFGGDSVAISIISLLQSHSGGDSLAISIISLLPLPPWISVPRQYLFGDNSALDTVNQSTNLTRSLFCHKPTH